MSDTKLSIIEMFYKALNSKDTEVIQRVLSEKVKWIFPGRNHLSGTKVGVNSVVSFFDKFEEGLEGSNGKVEKLIISENNNYVLECNHIVTSRADGVNLDQDICVLWTFKDGKIIEGKHLTEDQFVADTFFNKVCKR